MGWAASYIQSLKEGKAVQFRPRGNSMIPLISSGALVTVIPCGPEEIKKGDVVLCKVKGREYLHLVKAVKGSSFLIGNNVGRTNGWTSSVFGKCVEVDHT